MNSEDITRAVVGKAIAINLGQGGGSQPVPSAPVPVVDIDGPVATVEPRAEAKAEAEPAAATDGARAGPIAKVNSNLFTMVVGASAVAALVAAGVYSGVFNAKPSPAEPEPVHINKSDQPYVPPAPQESQGQVGVAQEGQPLPAGTLPIGGGESQPAPPMVIQSDAHAPVAPNVVPAPAQATPLPATPAAVSPRPQVATPTPAPAAPPKPAAKAEDAKKAEPQPSAGMLLDVEAASKATKQVVIQAPAATSKPSTPAQATTAPASPAPAAAAAAGTGLVAITADGKTAVFTNPKTRLPEQFKVGDKLTTGETIKAIDFAAGKVSTTAKEYRIE